MPKPKRATPQQQGGLSSLLLEPSLHALHKLLQGVDLLQQTVALALPADQPAGGTDTDTDTAVVRLSGVGAPSGGGGCELPRGLLLRASAYYAHAASFSSGPHSSISLEFGDRCVQLLGAALSEGTALLGPDSLAELLQAAAYLQVAAVLEACAAYLRSSALMELHPGAVLRVALDLGLEGLAAYMEADFLKSFYMLSGEKAATVLKEWPPDRRRHLLASPQLLAPTECCLVETLCHLARCACSADAVGLLGCVQLERMTAHELAAAALFIQHNGKWVDRRLGTALAWRLLSVRVAADVAAWPNPNGGSMPAGCGAGFGPSASNGSDDSSGRRDGGQGESGGMAPRAARCRCLLSGLSTARLAGWAGTVMRLSSGHIPLSWDSANQGPMALQLEREDPRHAAAEAVGGTTGRVGGDTDSGGSGWDLQLSLEPHKFPPGFKAVCWAFGGEGFFWCPLGPLAKPGPTWWKVGFLASQLPRAMPLAALQGGASGGGGLYGTGDDALLLVGWWVPEQ